MHFKTPIYLPSAFFPPVSKCHNLLSPILKAQHNILVSATNPRSPPYTTPSSQLYHRRATRPLPARRHTTLRLDSDLPSLSIHKVTSMRHIPVPPEDKVHCMSSTYTTYFPYPSFAYSLIPFPQWHRSKAEYVSLNWGIENPALALSERNFGPHPELTAEPRSCFSW